MWPLTRLGRCHAPGRSHLAFVLALAVAMGCGSGVWHGREFDVAMCVARESGVAVVVNVTMPVELGMALDLGATLEALPLPLGVADADGSGTGTATGAML